jgi:hypothetical protein
VRLRAALAVLAGLGVVAIGLECKGSAIVPSDVAENLFYISGIAKNVVIGDAGKNEERPIHHGRNHRETSRTQLSSKYQEGRATEGFGLVKKQAFDVAIYTIRQPEIDIAIDIVSRGRAVVSKVQPDPRRDIVGPFDHYKFNPDVGSQLMFGGPVRTFDQLDGRAPQKPSGNTKNDRESSNNTVGIQPVVSLAPRERRPFLPVFGLGALTFIAGMLVPSRSW